MQLTIMVNLPFHAWLAITGGGMLTHVLEVLRNLVHFMPLEVSDNDVDVVAATIVHAAKEHKFWELW